MNPLRTPSTQAHDTPNHPGVDGADTRSPQRIGCVSYLNAKPLIDGLAGDTGPRVRYDVPSGLLADLESGRVDVALCPAIDYHTSSTPLVIVPIGGIGCHSRTWTVRLFSRVPFGEMRQIVLDTDSHTSVALLRIILAEHLRLDLNTIEFIPRGRAIDTRTPAVTLLIGDKVVLASQQMEASHPHQLDLGQAWHEMTGLPFVFAVWMARRGTDVRQVAKELLHRRLTNTKRIDQIVERHAAAHGYPHDLAKQYLGSLLCYDIGQPQVEALRTFGSLAAAHGLIPRARPLELAAVD